MKTITLNETLLVLAALDAVTEKLPPESKYAITKVRYTLEASIELVKPLLTGDKEKDQWAQEAKTLPFEPLVFGEVFASAKRMKPQHFKALKAICLT
jgi:hypothetical protein